MFQTASGVKIPHAEKLKEEFQLSDDMIRLNLSFEKIKPMLHDFIMLIEEPIFLILHLPLKQQEEEALRKNNTDPFHQKVYYLGHRSKEQVIYLLQKYGELLLNDGMSRFGIASQTTNDEFFIRKYKLIDIYSKKPAYFLDLMRKYGVTQTDNLITAWKLFSHETPGETHSIEIKGMTAVDVYRQLIPLGMFEVEVIDEE